MFVYVFSKLLTGCKENGHIAQLEYTNEALDEDDFDDMYNIFKPKEGPDGAPMERS